MEAPCKGCSKPLEPWERFCSRCGTKVDAPPPGVLTVYVPLFCPDEKLGPLYDRLMTALRVAGEVRETTIHDPTKGDVQVFAATFDAATLHKKLEEVPFWLRKMLGL